MQGDVLYFDAERGVGFVTGDDGNRYHFDRDDLPGGLEPAKGMRVAFVPAGNRARAITSTAATPQPQPQPQVPEPASGRTAARPRASVPSVSEAGQLLPDRGAEPSEPGNPASLFGYFRLCMTQRYARFQGRASRKEFWGFALFFFLATLALVTAGAILDGAIGNLDAEQPVFLTLLPLAGVLAMLVPSIAVTVRRIHDIGLSGWFYLLGFIPTIGSLIILVFALVPSQKQANKWGEGPGAPL